MTLAIIFGRILAYSSIGTHQIGIFNRDRDTSSSPFRITKNMSPTHSSGTTRTYRLPDPGTPESDALFQSLAGPSAARERTDASPTTEVDRVRAEFERLTPAERQGILDAVDKTNPRLQIGARHQSNEVWVDGSPRSFAEGLGTALGKTFGRITKSIFHPIDSLKEWATPPSRIEGLQSLLTREEFTRLAAIEPERSPSVGYAVGRAVGGAINLVLHPIRSVKELASGPGYYSGGNGPMVAG